MPPTVHQPTFGTVIAGTVSTTELQSAYLRNQAWLNQVLIKGKKIPSITEQLIAQGHMREGGTTFLPVRYSIEKDRYINTITVDAAAAPAIGANQTLTVSLGTYNQNGESKAFATAIVRYPDGTTGRITARTAAANNDVLTIQPVSGPQLPAVLQGTQLILMSPAVGEANVPVPRYMTTDVWAYRHGMQHVSNSTKITDFKVEFDQNGKFTSKVGQMVSPFTGGMVDTWFSQELQNLFDSCMTQWDMTVVLGQTRGTTGVNTLAQGENIMGLIPAFQAGAQQFIAPVGNYTAGDIRLMVAAYNAAGYGSTMHRMMLGLNIYNKMNDYILSLGQQDTRQGTGNEYYNYAYKGIKGISGHDFEYALVNQFSDSRTGFQQQGFEDFGWIIPEATTADTITGEQVPLLQIYYMAPYKGIEGGVGSGMWKWTWQKGPSFVGPNEAVTTTDMANFMQVAQTGAFQTVFHQLDQFGIIQ